MSLFGPNENVQAVFASLQAVLGPGEIERFNVGGDACYRLRGQHRGRPMEAVVTTDGGILSSVRFEVFLGQRPITLLLNHRKNTSIYAVPEVRTGDPDFDGVFLLNGFPAEVLRDALDAPTRAWLLERFRTAEPTVETEDGSIRIRVPLRAKEGILALPYGREIPPAEVAYWLDAIGALGDRLAGAFDHHQAEITRTRGPEAAAQWARAQLGEMSARATRRSNLRLLLVLVFVGLPLLGSAMFAALMIALALWGTWGS